MLEPRNYSPQVGSSPKPYFWCPVGDAVSHDAAPREHNEAFPNESFKGSSQNFSPLPKAMRNISSLMDLFTQKGYGQRQVNNHEEAPAVLS